jgi:hypothetical protein
VNSKKKILMGLFYEGREEEAIPMTRLVISGAEGAIAFPKIHLEKLTDDP